MERRHYILLEFIVICVSSEIFVSSTMSKEGSEKLMVAAIDFGTTFSGYAFSFHHEFLRDPLKMNASQWSAGSKSEISLKTSSCILFDMNKTFVAFGLEAEDIYRNLTLDQLEGDWYYFRMIKMLLYNSQDVHRTMMITEEGGKHMYAMDVFSEAIGYLKRHAMYTFAESGLGITDKEIKWVLTVPGIWGDAAKQFMREAAEKAEGEVQPNEEEDSLEVDEGSGLATKKKKLLTALTPEQEEEMVEWLSEHPVLWNKKMKDYKDTQMKEALWIEQAGKMDKDVNELKVWYKSLRTRFGRLKKMPSGSGTQEFSERDKWILQKLEFLRPHIADVSKRTAVSFRAKMGLQQQSEQPCLDEDDIDEPEPPRPAVSAQCSLSPVGTQSSTGSVTSARSEKKQDQQERDIYKLQQQLLDHLKKPQPTEERDCYADWLRSVFHSFDNSLFRRCQREISSVVVRYQDLNESPQEIITAVPASSSQSLQPTTDHVDNQQQGTSQPQQLCSMQWQPHPSTWPTNVHNPHVSVWGSQDVQWVQQQQIQQEGPQAAAANPAMTFSSLTQQSGNQEYDNL